MDISEGTIFSDPHGNAEWPPTEHEGSAEGLKGWDPARTLVERTHSYVRAGATMGRPRITTARRDGAKPNAVLSVMRSIGNSSAGVFGMAFGRTMP
jgi:hypothetical protein